jgi:ribose 5-phosphate isomerase B
MKIAIASDHAGFPLKEEGREFVAKRGHDVRGPSLNL